MAIEKNMRSWRRLFPDKTRLLFRGTISPIIRTLIYGPSSRWCFRPQPHPVQCVFLNHQCFLCASVSGIKCGFLGRLLCFSKSILILFAANRGRFTPAKPRNRPRASWNEFAYSRRGTHLLQKSVCPPAQFELLPTSQNLVEKIWSTVAPNPTTGLFSIEGSRRDCGFVTRNERLISSVYRSEINTNAKNVKIERDAILSA